MGFGSLEDGLRRRTSIAAAFAWAACACVVAGCGDRPPAPDGSAVASRTATSAAGARQPEPAAKRPPEVQSGSSTPRAKAGPVQSEPAQPRERTLVDLLDDQPSGDALPGAQASPRWPRVEVDEARAEAAGIHKVSGPRLTLYTDVAIDDEIEALPVAFAQAFPQWCEYFGVDPATLADWQMTGFLMEDKSRFEKLGLLPEELPPFEHGFARDYDLWVYEQPSAYYRRHLVLHEGTHGFMNTVLGGCGPAWYMEGMAELLATHRWKDGVLTLNTMPQSRDEVPMWGRIKIIKDDFAAKRAQQFDQVLLYRPEVQTGTEPYAWCWAAAALLDRHPRYRERFRQLPRIVRAGDFTEQFRRLIGSDWPDLTEEWQVFVAGMEYGYDVPAAAIEFAPGKPLPANGGRATVEATRGWQSSGLRLEAHTTYRIAAQGRYQVADQPQIWWSEPGGVSIRYYQGRPLGMLLGAVRPDPPDAGPISALIQPIPIGLGTTLTPEHAGTLYLRINDSAAELSDNAGRVTVDVRSTRGHE